MKNKQDMICLSDVKQRSGWTDASIKKFLGDPDDTAMNHRRRSGPRIKLYAIKRIDKAEKTAAFKAWKEKSLQRSKAAKKAADKKRDELLSYINALEIEIPLKDDNI
jgi:hypothetical protein